MSPPGVSISQSEELALLELDSDLDPDSESEADPTALRLIGSMVRLEPTEVVVLKCTLPMLGNTELSHVTICLASKIGGSDPLLGQLAHVAESVNSCSLFCVGACPHIMICFKAPEAKETSSDLMLAISSSLASE